MKHHHTLIVLASVTGLGLVAGLGLAARAVAGEAAAKGVASNVPAARKPADARRVTGVQGLWVWRANSMSSEKAAAELIDFATANGFNRLFVQIRFEPGTVQAGTPVVAHQEGWKHLLRLAAQKSVKVEALDGDPEMARASRHGAELLKLDAILAFNREQPVGEKLAGVHYDIEPYTSQEWKTGNRDLVMKEFLSFLKQAGQKIHAADGAMVLSADIPFWYDHKTEPADSCMVEFEGVTKNFHQHIQDLTDYVGVMTYRQKALGPNSVTLHAKSEVEYAGSIGKTACTALEVGPLKETPNLTFFGLPTEEFWAQKKLAEETMGKEAGYGGMLVHSYEHLRNYLTAPRPGADAATPAPTPAR